MNLTPDCPVKPLPFDEIFEKIETKAILKKLAIAHRSLAELKGVVQSIPNQTILINTLSLQEAKHSSEIENIITTQDELYQADLSEFSTFNPAVKEVQRYSYALNSGFNLIKQEQIIRLNTLLMVQEQLEHNNAGLRAISGTALKNAYTGKTVYTPPQHKNDIILLMENLIEFINTEDRFELDPLTKMAIIHHQFESIHPFYDGNGRTGRILNILYLVKENLLDIPILYLSRYLIENKSDYYTLLQAVRDSQNWEDWVQYILNAIIETAQSTIELVKQIKILMQNFKNQFRSELPKIYSQDLLNQLFMHPYSKIAFIQNHLGVSDKTAKRYLDELCRIGLLKKEKIGRENFYINYALFDLFIKY
ncbi:MULTISPECIES: Fic family protein [Pasteurellaceae]|uniref:Protein adenylyltransferase n=3 Tax=Pasteurellaceae TaxID=712 RepID=A0A1H7X848_9PAST|nr:MULTISPECIES: Fic/DOC family N-terminal domain-containing protein [Pasteurella]MBR0573793.1 Fic family protein [Pasteurella atlantica]MDP8039729.1 Fic/DOC family N-terminal domain-containing protein [Pasteurella atlantica]MDP8041914.1 Fic/DOC family N-terminal domain-containing protein [Pasteurella atlantica]MDP8044061.1 Fic/DOC family N-terminal domain-containing protein [Pasteurella atlantica]MDP8046039.1 Fic/DOC family N-terminal domain-containing protein [Pasteurella atlantica]